MCWKREPASFCRNFPSSSSPWLRLAERAGTREKWEERENVGTSAEMNGNSSRASQAPWSHEGFYGSHVEDSTQGCFQIDPSQRVGRGVLLSLEVPWGENLQTKVVIRRASRILILEHKKSVTRILTCRERVKVILGWSHFSPRFIVKYTCSCKII